jgi:amidase
MEGQETVHSVSGPLCHSISDMRLFMTSVLAGKPWDFDSKVIPMPWRESEEAIIKNKVSSPSLTLGFYTSDGVVLPHPPILRGIRTVVQKLQEAGHTVVPWEPYKHDEALSILGKVYAADGGADIRSVLEASGEPNIPNISHYVQEGLPKTDINDLWSLHLDKWSYQCEYLAAIRALEEKLGKELDAIIAPVAPTAAIRHNKFEYYGYTTVVNLLDFTSVVVPVTFADKAVDMADPSHKPLNETDAIVQGEYDPGAYHGAPVAVQIIGRRLTEERTMAIAEEIGRLLGNETAS